MVSWKLELDLEQAFDLRGYQFSLKEGKVRPTLEHLQTLSAIQKLLRTNMPGPAAHAPDSITDSHSKARPHRWPSLSGRYSGT